MNENQLGVAPRVIEAFTEGDCWLLALGLARRTCWPMVFINDWSGVEEDEWCHVLVKHPDGEWIDIHGKNHPYDVKSHWRSFNFTEVAVKDSVEWVKDQTPQYKDIKPKRYIDELERLYV